MTKLRIASAVGLATGTVLWLVATKPTQVQSQVVQGKSYRMISIESSRQDGGEPRALAVRTRLVRASGEWKEEIVSLKKGSEGHKQTVYNGADGQYLRTSKSQDLHLIDGFAQSWSGFRSSDLLRKHPEFIRTESLLGFTTYVLRGGSPDNYIEQYYCPEVGGIPIKVVMHYATGLEQVIEAVQIDFLVVTDGDLARPKLPVKLDFLETKIDQAERNGQMEYAESLRRVARLSTPETKK